MSVTVDAALSLASAGWPVLPLRGKIPVTAHGVLDATTDPAQVRLWWRRREPLNVGARVPAHLLVLDFDPQNGGSVEALEAAAGVRLPPTLTVHSGRGTGGRHLYFRRPAGSLSSTRLPTGIDVKTDRGYCVMPPSLHPLTDAPYTWEEHAPAHLPAAVVALLAPPARPARPSPARGDVSARALYLARHVEQAREGNRNACLYWAACQAVRDGHPDTTFDLLEGAGMVAGLSEVEARRTVQSARRGAGG